MADSVNEQQQVKAVVHPMPKEEEQAKEEVAPAAEAKAESQEEESDVEECDEEVILDLDEPSDSENYEPKIKEGEEEGKEDDDDSCSSGEEEEPLDYDEVVRGGQKFYKLVYKDLQAKKKELEKRMQQEEEAESQEDDTQEEESQEEGAVGGKSEEKEKPAVEFKEYRTATIVDEDMQQDYNSDEDEPYNPIDSDLSDVEYAEEDERDTESEPETEKMEGTHKKTGEGFVCLKMMEQLKIPPRDQPCASGELHAIQKPTDQPMECT